MDVLDLRDTSLPFYFFVFFYNNLSFSPSFPSFSTKLPSLHPPPNVLFHFILSPFSFLYFLSLFLFPPLPPLSCIIHCLLYFTNSCTYSFFFTASASFPNPFSCMSPLQELPLTHSLTRIGFLATGVVLLVPHRRDAHNVPLH